MVKRLVAWLFDKPALPGDYTVATSLRTSLRIVDIFRVSGYRPDSARLDYDSLKTASPYF